MLANTDQLHYTNYIALACHITNILIVELGRSVWVNLETSIVCTDLTTFTLYSRPRSRFSLIFPSLAEIHYHQTNLKGHVCVVGNKSRIRVQPPSPETRYVHVEKIVNTSPQFMMKFWYKALGLVKKRACFIGIQMFSKQGKVTFEFSFRHFDEFDLDFPYGSDKRTAWERAICLQEPQLHGGHCKQQYCWNCTKITN